MEATTKRVAARTFGDRAGSESGNLARVGVGQRMGRYVLTAELGKGGMGRVFLAHDTDLDRFVAIKFVAVLDAEMVTRFVAEARVTARCTHPNIVSVYEIGQHRGAPYLVLEHLDGPTLAQLMVGERLPIQRVVTIMTAVARALSCAHSHGIVHRDLKPSNIAVLADDTAKVLDFGVAAFAHRHADQDVEEANRSHPPEFAGTLPYMAPEQLRDTPIDGRVDLWAFGVILHQLLVGVGPFDHLAEVSLRAELLDVGRPTPIGPIPAGVPAALTKIISRCLEKPRARRYRSAGELLAALQRAAGDQAACPLPMWLATAPSAAEGDQVALGLVRALASCTATDRIAPASARVWPDGRVELPNTVDGLAASDQIRTVAELASQAIDCVGGIRTPLEQRRARRMRRVLAPALRRDARSRCSARELESRLATAHSPRRSRGAAIMTVGALVVMAALAKLVAWRASPAAPDVAAITPSLVQRFERLEGEMARLRSTGDHVAADALFDGFVAQPDSAPLRADAWLRRSDRELASGQLERALESAATAYLVGNDDRETTRALATIASVQVSRRRWDEVVHALAVLGPSTDPAVMHMAALAAIATRRPLPDGTSPGVAAASRLLVGRPETTAIRTAEPLDLDGDGREEILAIDRHTVRALRPGDGVLLWEMRLGSPASGVLGDATCAARVGSDAWMAISGPVTHLFHLDAAGATLVSAATKSSECAIGDLDGDGAPELYLAADHELVRYRPDDDGVWQATHHPLGSRINGLVIADLDGDGGNDLAIAAGEWRAFDVRVLAGADLHLVDRIRLGRVAGLTAVARGPGAPSMLLARKDQDWGSLVYLPRHAPNGAPEGIYALRLDHGRLRVTGHLAEGMTGHWGALRAADLDGDGRDEGLANEHSAYTGGLRIRVVHIDDAGRLDSTIIEGVAALAAGRLTDGHDTVLARVEDGAVTSCWWLGLGTTALSPIATTALPLEVAIPAEIDATLATTWRRAATLGRVGAFDRAHVALEQLAVVMPARFQAAVLDEVLAMTTRQGEPRGAVYHALATRAPPGTGAQLDAVTGAVQAASYDGDLAMAGRTVELALSSPALTATQRSRLQEAHARIAPAEITIFGGAPLDRTWEVIDPIGVRRDPVTRKLVLDGFGTHPLATSDLRRGSGPIELIVEATVTRAEWGAGIRFELRPVGTRAPPVGVTLSTVGGGGVYALAAEHHAEWPHRGVDTPVAVRVHATLLPDTGRVIWEFSVDGKVVRRAVQAGGQGEVLADTTSHWRLEISSDNCRGCLRAARMAMTITRIAVSGMEPAPRSQDSLAAARLALANGDLRGARDHLAGMSGHDASITEAVIDLRAGDRAAAISALARLRSTTTHALNVWAHLARVDDGAHASAVGAAAGPDKIAVLTEAWATVALQHPTAELVQRELTQNLRALALPRHGDPPLLLLRARAHAAIGEIVEAEADLDRLLAADGRGAVAASVRADAYLERARIAAGRGRGERVELAINAAIDASPWPQTIEDRVLLDPNLAPFADRPGLGRVRSVGRTLWLPVSSTRSVFAIAPRSGVP